MTSYTFSKLISNVQGENPSLGGGIGNGEGGTQNAYNRKLDKAISNQDVPHHVVLAYSYELPVGKGKRLLNTGNVFVESLLGGWKLSAIHNYQSGYPMRVTSNQNIGLFSGGIRANIVGGQPLKNPDYKGDPNKARYINTAAFSRPPNFTFGNGGAQLPGLRSPPLLAEDVTLGKEFPLFGEGRHLEFKASAFNIGNRVQFGGINIGVENQDFGRITSQSNRAREIQLSLRLVF